MRPIFLLPLVFLPAHGQPLAQQVAAAVRSAPGTVSLYAKNLDTGAEYGLRADAPVRTASTIKLPVMVAVFGEVEAGRAKFTEEIAIRDDEKISGSGVLKEFSAGVKIPLRDLVHLMIVVSDNTATNMVLDRIAADTVNRYMDELRLPQTRSLRKVLGDRNQLKPNPSGWSEAGKLETNKRYGIGVSTPREMVALLEKLERGEVVSAAASKEMIEILKRQQYTDGIARRVGDTKTATKSGALDALRSDVGIVYSKGGRIALAITVDGMKGIDYSPDNPGLLLISRLSGILVKGLQKR
jgi:beta-lactamase class A